MALLNKMADKDAERENDLLAMLSDWRESGHNKYLTLGYRLLQV